jgi:signal transduction histidine kinase
MAMSLKARIILLTIAVTASIVTALFLVQINNVIESWLTSSEEIAQVAGEQIKDLLLVRLEERSPAGVSAADAPQVWTDTLAHDQHMNDLLEGTMAHAQGIIEISIAGADGSIVASSDPHRLGAKMVPQPALARIMRLPPIRRALRVLKETTDYDITIPLGFADQHNPIFTIQVIISSILLRDKLLAPALWGVAEWGLAGLMASIVLAYASASLAVANLNRLGLAIDRIRSGETPTRPPETSAAAREFAIIESKLDLLGHQFRGAIQGATEFRSDVQKVLEVLEEAILLFDSDERVVLCGGAAERLLGLGGDAVAGQSLEAVFPLDTPLGALARGAFDRRQALSGATVQYGAALLLVSIEFAARPQNPSRFTALMRIRDAEGHHRLESQLGLSARIDAMSRITSSVAHEIKNPLNSIAVRLDYLQSWATNDFPEAEQEIQCIFQEVNRLDRVVRSFLDFTRPVELAQVDVDIVSLAHDVADLLRPDAARRGVAVEFSAEAPELFVRGDEDVLKEAIINVATNGIEAMAEGGVLRIQVSESHGWSRVDIADTGGGVPEGMREKIFQLYFTTKDGGSGLGLPMAYRAMQLHGGSIDLESTPGRGTSIRLNLPLVAVRESAVEGSGGR